MRIELVEVLALTTAVAGWDDEGAFRTAKYWSSTTTRHINKYLGGIEAREISQEEINRKVA